MKIIDSIVATGTNKYNMMLVLGHNKKSNSFSKKKVLQLKHFQKELNSIQKLKSRIEKLEVKVLQKVMDVSNL